MPEGRGPQSMKGLFDEFEQMTMHHIPADHPARGDAKIAFYSGAFALLTVMLISGEGGTEEEQIAADANLLESIHGEIEQFFMNMQPEIIN